MEKRLEGKVAFVTGSGGLIGPAIVRRLAGEGAAKRRKCWPGKSSRPAERRAPSRSM